MNRNKYKNQFASTLCGNIIAIACGASFGWPSASLPILQSPESPLDSGPLTLDEASWVVSIIGLGGFSGNIFYGWLSNKYTRKFSLLSMVVPQILSWLLIIFGTQPTHLYVARFFAGTSIAGNYILLPQFTTEISDEEIRGLLGSLYIASANIGTLLSFILGNFLTYKQTAIVLLMLPISFFCGFIFCPDTPQSFLRAGNEEAAEKSLLFYRSESIFSSRSDLENLKEQMKRQLTPYGSIQSIQSIQDRSLSYRDFVYPTARKALTIGIVLVAIGQLNGAATMLNYTASIFAKVGSTFTPNVSAIIVGVLQLVGSYVSTILVEKSGRKILLISSSTGVGMGLACYIAYIYLDCLDFNIEPYRWISVVLFCFTIFIASVGVLTLPTVVISEIMPENIRTIGISICMSLLWIIAFILLKYFPILAETYGVYSCFIFFMLCSFAGSIFVMFGMPETKGESLENIHRLLENL